MPAGVFRPCPNRYRKRPPPILPCRNSGIVRLLAFHPGCHDASAAAFDDYRLVAAVEEERLTRVKGSGQGVSWLAVDEVLRIAGWSRHDVDAPHRAVDALAGLADSAVRQVAAESAQFAEVAGLAGVAAPPGEEPGPKTRCRCQSEGR